MMQLNPKLNQPLILKIEFPTLLGNNLVPDRLEAAEALRRTENSKKISENPLPENSHGVAASTAAQEGVGDGRSSATKHPPPKKLIHSIQSTVQYFQQSLLNIV